MSPILPPGVRRLFRLAPRRSRDVDADMDEEIRTHLAMRTDQLIALGYDPGAARAEALRRFGDLEMTRAGLRHGAQRRETRVRRREQLESIWRDAVYAARQLRRAPVFSAAVILTFALAIGANATMFGIIDRLLLRPPAYLTETARTQHVYLRHRTPEGFERIDNNMSYTRYLELRGATHAFDETAAFWSPAMIVGTGDEARKQRTGAVSASFWRLFDARPVIGRFFGDAEDHVPSGDAVTVLSYNFWQARYGGRTDVIGRPLRIGAREYVIIGVAPPRFTGVSLTPLVAFVPITAVGADLFGDSYYQRHDVSWMEMIARRRVGVSEAAAAADLTAAYRTSMATEPEARPLTESRPQAVLASVLRDRGPMGGADARVAAWLGGVTLIVLLIACANVANLLLARARRRAREIAVRVALGVKRGRLIAQLLAESVLLGVLGGAAGLALAHWGGGVLRGTLLPDIDWTSGVIDARMLFVTATATLAASVLAGLAPALQSSTPDIAATLKGGGREGSVHRSRTRATLLVLQVGLCTMLLVGAGLFARSLHNVRSVDLGFDAENVLYLSLETGGVRLEPNARRALNQRLIERVRAMPQVENATLTVSVPFYQSWSEDLFVPGIDSVSKLGDLTGNAVSPEYFATMGTRIVRGRGLTRADGAGAHRVMIVSRSLARALWPHGNALGQCVKMGADTMPCGIVVGIAQDIHSDHFTNDGMLQFYIPSDQGTGPPNSDGILVRVRGDARRELETIRREMQTMAPGNSFVSARALQDLVDPNLRQWRLGATMFSVFGALAVLLAAVGLYGVIAFDVSQRMHEFGVRVALGARTHDILGLVVGDGVRHAALGIALGTAAALGLSHAAAPLLYGVSARDPIVYGIVAGALVVIAIVASFIPARRGARANPSSALRAD